MPSSCRSRKVDAQRWLDGVTAAMVTGAYVAFGDPAKLEKAIVKYGVGSILNVSDQALTLDRWHEFIAQIQDAAKKTRLGIPVIYGIDSIHGANYVQGATLFPQEIGMAATWTGASQAGKAPA